MKQSALSPSACATVLILGVASFACAPKQGEAPQVAPGCQSDSDCLTETASADGAYCVAGACQQCRETAHCEEGYRCEAGRCEFDSECPCQPGETCQEGRCVALSCNTHADCGPGEKCQGSVCLASAEMQFPMVCPIEQLGGKKRIVLDAVNFEFDAAMLTKEAQVVLQATASCLKQLPDAEVVLEGHCNERGTQEYNLGLGQRRAVAVGSYLKHLGVTEVHLRTISKGKNEPVCSGGSENCHSKNRRVELLPQDSTIQ